MVDSHVGLDHGGGGGLVAGAARRSNWRIGGHSSSDLVGSRALR